MNIIEAIKSGKRFRHSLTGTSWFNPIKDPDTSLVLLKLDVNQLVSNDWEVEESEVTITRSQFDSAWDRITVDSAWDRIIVYDAPKIKELLAKELGL